MQIFRNRQFRRVMLALAIPVALATTACSDTGRSSAPADRLLDRTAAEQEYRDTAKHLTLPAGVQFPESIPQTQEKTVYERGFGTSIAENYWICSWAREWLSQRARDAAREKTALAQLEKAPQTEFMTLHLDEPGRRFFNDHLTRARLGDPGGFQQYVTQNCAN